MFSVGSCSLEGYLLVPNAWGPRRKGASLLLVIYQDGAIVDCNAAYFARVVGDLTFKRGAWCDP